MSRLDSAADARLLRHAGLREACVRTMRIGTLRYCPKPLTASLAFPLTLARAQTQTQTQTPSPKPQAPSAKPQTHPLRRQIPTSGPGTLLLERGVSHGLSLAEIAAMMCVP